MTAQLFPCGPPLPSPCPGRSDQPDCHHTSTPAAANSEMRRGTGHDRHQYAQPAGHLASLELTEAQHLDIIMNVVHACSAATGFKTHLAMRHDCLARQHLATKRDESDNICCWAAKRSRARCIEVRANPLPGRMAWPPGGRPAGLRRVQAGARCPERARLGSRRASIHSWSPPITASILAAMSGVSLAMTGTAARLSSTCSGGTGAEVHRGCASADQAAQSCQRGAGWARQLALRRQLTASRHPLAGGGASRLVCVRRANAGHHSGAGLRVVNRPQPGTHANQHTALPAGLVRAWEILVAPVMTEETLGFRAHQASASCTSAGQRGRGRSGCQARAGRGAPAAGVGACQGCRQAYRLQVRAQPGGWGAFVGLLCVGVVTCFPSYVADLQPPTRGRHQCRRVQFPPGRACSPAHRQSA